MPLPTNRSPEEKRLHELEGGVVVIGRHTFKEFMTGLRRGWTDSLEKVDEEESLARELQDDDSFDDSEEPLHDFEPAREKPSFLSPENSPVYSPLKEIHPLVGSHLHAESSPIPLSINSPPEKIPAQPPILLVPFTNFIGFTQIPLMIWDFFNHRQKVQAGAEAAYKLIMKCTRPFVGPSPTVHDNAMFPPPSSSIEQGDLNFDREVESYYKSSLSSTVQDIESARTKYYKELPAKLKVARDLERGIRIPTKDELNYPPPTEVELRAERLRWELRWRRDVEGWEIVRPDSEVAWDERFNNALSVFVDPLPGEAEPENITPRS